MQDCGVCVYVCILYCGAEGTARKVTKEEEEEEVERALCLVFGV